MAFEKYSRSGIMLLVVPLYTGPVLAGVSAAPWAAVPVFAALFTALTQKTRSLPDQAVPLAIVIAFALILNGAVALALFSLGRGLALMTGPFSVPFLASLAVSAAATVFGIWRYRWTPEQAQMDAAIDEALEQVSQMQIDETDRD